MHTCDVYVVYKYMTNKYTFICQLHTTYSIHLFHFRFLLAIFHQLKLTYFEIENMILV